jgi:hypothetical protein
MSEFMTKAYVNTCLLQHYSKKLSYGNSLDVPLLMNGLKKCEVYTQWNFTQTQRSMKFCCLQVNGWNSSEVSQFRRPKGACFLSFVVYIHNTHK